MDEAPRVKHCGARICGMHPQHLHTLENGEKVRCPGSGD